MTNIEYFKSQAKKFFKDWKTKTLCIDNVDGSIYYEYDPRHFDVDSFFFDYEHYNESEVTLMKAQHFIAVMVGFKNWAALLMASESELEIAKLLLVNRDKIDIDAWRMYIHHLEHDNAVTLDSEAKLHILKNIWLKDTYPENSV